MRNTFTKEQMAENKELEENIKKRRERQQKIHDERERASVLPPI